MALRDVGNGKGLRPRLILCRRFAANFVRTKNIPLDLAKNRRTRKLNDGYLVCRP
jgi:hypothetical protein